MSTDPPPVLEARGVVKSFGSTRALRGVDLRLAGGRCLGLVGRNGAGKSTLVSILSGLVEADAGTVLFDGRPAPPIKDIGAWRTRIATVYQHSMVVPQLTVAENVFLGAQQTRNGLIDWRQMHRRTTAVMQEWGFDIPADARCEDLGVDQLQIVEIARALATGSRCLLLDEPTAALERTGVAILFDRVHQLIARGVAILYISHHLEEVFEICDDVSVLRDGSVVHEAPIGALTKDDLVAAMVGDVAANPAPSHVRGSLPIVAAAAAAAAAVAPGVARLRVTDLRRATIDGALRGVSLDVGAGERVGVTGLLSAGVATLGEIVAGVQSPDRGTVVVDGRPMRTGRRDVAQRAGVGYIPADRQVDGFVAALGIAENATMTVVGRLSRPFGFLRPGARRQAVAPLARALAVVSADLDQPVEELSGGNQQKVVVARTLIHEPKVIVAITPTRGVDVAAKELLLDALSDAASLSGAAVLIASDELDDLQSCDRVIVLVRGEVFAEFRPPFDREQLIAASEGITPAASVTMSKTYSGE